MDSGCGCEVLAGFVGLAILILVLAAMAVMGGFSI